MKNSISAEELLKAMETQLSNFPLPDHTLQNNLVFQGMPVIEHQPTFEPVLQIRPEFRHCSDEFRNRMNSWLLRRFGSYDTSILKPCEVFILNNQTIIARPEVTSILRHFT